MFKDLRARDQSQIRLAQKSTLQSRPDDEFFSREARTERDLHSKFTDSRTRRGVTGSLVGFLLLVLAPANFPAAALSFVTRERIATQSTATTETEGEDGWMGAGREGGREGGREAGREIIRLL